MSAVASPLSSPRTPSRVHRARRLRADAMRWLPLFVPLAALGLCGLTALIWSAVLFVA